MEVSITNWYMGMSYKTVPEQGKESCSGCFAETLEASDACYVLRCGSSPETIGVIWVAVDTQTGMDRIKSILTRMRPIVKGLTQITDHPAGEDLQLLKDIDQALEKLK